MNLLKKFIRDTGIDSPDMGGDDYSDLYEPDDLVTTDIEEEVASLDSPTRKDPEFHPATADKVSLKLLQPKSHTEATKIADKLKDGCIVLLDISYLTKEQALRLVDFVAGVAYVLGGEMIKTNKNTIVVSPSGVDISGFAQEEPASEEAPVAEEEYVEAEELSEEEYEEL
ncbi:MAG: cell division protein SepF [Ruminococcaceae bacterium]|nr:cell division protein SepF [Oscillospiraceae bacterium]